MRKETKENVFFDNEEHTKFYNFMKENNLSMGVVADKLDVTYDYLYKVVNGKRAFTKKLEEKLANIGFKL